MSRTSAARPVRVGITLGDPRGIGPEVTLKAISDPSVKGEAEFVIIGPGGLLEGPWAHVDIGRWGASGDAATAGALAGDAIERGVRMALAGEVDALVTAPIDKAAFRAGGWEYPGHTEMLQALTAAPEVVMLMASEGRQDRGALRVALATTHLPLRDVPGVLSEDLLVAQASLTSESLHRWWRIETPRIALCAFNPHASDQGLFGDEEERIYGPALRRLESLKVATSGPVPADTVFIRALSGEFDAVIAPYHDVGMAAFKTATFGTGVNVTLGLPFPRTSPDHGTALEIAGKGIADPSSMVEAVRLAIRLGRGDL
jgi:4-hydroxythreonine-4-phosphate dehydrogenase